ncbi:hypothetical protein GPALN_002096 [Globodera pallida]|nr:hypothetical protein GPALN_002096 [Globodera pallida]
MCLKGKSAKGKMPTGNVPKGEKCKRENANRQWAKRGKVQWGLQCLKACSKSVSNLFNSIVGITSASEAEHSAASNSNQRPLELKLADAQMLQQWIGQIARKIVVEDGIFAGIYSCGPKINIDAVILTDGLPEERIKKIDKKLLKKVQNSEEKSQFLKLLFSFGAMLSAEIGEQSQQNGTLRAFLKAYECVGGKFAEEYDGISDFVIGAVMKSPIVQLNVDKIILEMPPINSLNLPYIDDFSLLNALNIEMTPKDDPVKYRRIAYQLLVHVKNWGPEQLKELSLKKSDENVLEWTQNECPSATASPSPVATIFMRLFGSLSYALLSAMSIAMNCLLIAVLSYAMCQKGKSAKGKMPTGNVPKGEKCKRENANRQCAKRGKVQKGKCQQAMCQKGKSANGKMPTGNVPKGEKCKRENANRQCAKRGKCSNSVSEVFNSIVGITSASEAEHSAASNSNQRPLELKLADAQMLQQWIGQIARKIVVEDGIFAGIYSCDPKINIDAKKVEVNTLEKELEENKESAREMGKRLGQMLEEMKQHYGQKMDEQKKVA